MKDKIAAHPELHSFLTGLKEQFGTLSIVHIDAKDLKFGTQPKSGVQPYTHLPDDTWNYAVGDSPTSVKKKRK